MDHTNVNVKVVANLPRAVLVTIEPNDEDDWEILELNSELAEEAILKQVCLLINFVVLLSSLLLKFDVMLVWPYVRPFRFLSSSVVI